jgi:hypothetical protein
MFMGERRCPVRPTNWEEEEANRLNKLGQAQNRTSFAAHMGRVVLLVPSVSSASFRLSSP